MESIFKTYAIPQYEAFVQLAYDLIDAPAGTIMTIDTPLIDALNAVRGIGMKISLAQLCLSPEVSINEIILFVLISTLDNTTLPTQVEFSISRLEPESLV
jgi:hypothetical protein